MSIVKDTEKRIEQILKDREAAEAVAESKIAEAKEEAAAAAKRVEEAYTAGEPKAYSKAKHDRVEALDTVELYERSAEALRAKPLISKEDYESTVSAIYAEVEEQAEQARAKLCELAEAMESVANELQAVTAEANAVLKKLQSDVYRDADRSINKNTGGVMYYAHENKVINNMATIHWGKAAVTHAGYRAYTGKE